MFVINGQTPPPERQPTTEAFRKAGGALLLTRNGTEGRNLQFCHRLVNFDLPWNPMEIQQRIGRLHRIALTLAGGQPDDDLARRLEFAQLNPRPNQSLDWPALDLGACREQIQNALLAELAGDLRGIRARQESYLRRELDRIDDYFENYERELHLRVARSRSKNSYMRLAERLAAAWTEHERRRDNQIQRHEIQVVPHIDAVLLVAEPAWSAVVSVREHRDECQVEATYLPRARRWIVNQHRLDEKISR